MSNKSAIMTRHALHTITRADGTLECNRIKPPKKSPVAGEKDPEWMVLLHARERNGNAFVCADQNASLKEMSTVIAIWLIPTLKKMGISPQLYAREMLPRVFDAVLGNGGITEES